MSPRRYPPLLAVLLLACASRPTAPVASPEAAGAADAAQSSEATQSSESAGASEATGASEAAGASEATQSSEATPSSEAAAPQHAAQHDHGHGFHKDFSDAERFSKHFDDPARDAWQKPDAVLDAMRIPAGSTVVDLGAGTGYFVRRLSDRVGPNGKVLALDVEPKMVALLERRAKEGALANVVPRVVTPDDPGLSAGSVSRILIVNTWHHIDQRPAYAHKLADALAVGGEVWIVDFTLEARRGPPAKYRLSAERVIRELEQGGLHAELVEPEPLPEQYIVRAARRAP